MAIVVGTDLSEHSADAVTAALAIAARRGDDEVVMVNVLEHDTLAAPARARIDADAARLSRDSDIKVRGDVIVGPIVPSMIALTETEGGDLLVVSSKGHSNAPLTKLGGTSGAVAAVAAVPVLVVRVAGPFVAWAKGERPLKIMLGLDESASCEQAIGLLRLLRSAGPIDIVAAHVYYADEAARKYGLKTRNMVDSDPELERLLVRDLERRLGELPGSGSVVVRPRPGLGRIGDHLLEIADAENVDVILVGSRQKGGFGRLSSVSSLILHDAKQSVWCVPASAHLGNLAVPRFRVVVVATDLSDFGNHAVPYGYTLLGDRGGEVHLVHVRDEDHEGSDAESLDLRLHGLIPTTAAGVITRTHVVTGDDTARVIGETAERLGADVVVIASHARGGLSRVLLGSVADKVLRTCRRPVLILRPPVE
jgi:nucleotide-binding universal stress UspA family protein